MSKNRESYLNYTIESIFATMCCIWQEFLFVHRDLQELLQNCNIWDKLLPFCYHVHKIPVFESFSVRVYPNRPVVLRASLEAFPDQGADEGDLNESTSRLQAPDNLGAERREEDENKSQPRPLKRLCS